MARLILIGLLLVTGNYRIFAETLELPLPINPEAVVEHQYYTLEYDEEHETALWVAYELTADEVRGTVTRKDDFRADKMVLTGSANRYDYQGSGFDRGHLAPAGDMKISEAAMSESFYMSNMIPQRPAFNRGIWLELENTVRTWAVENGAVLIATGPLYGQDIPLRIGSSGVAVPEGFFKVILDYREPQLKAIAFLFANEGSDRPLAEFAVSVDEAERASGLDFFHGLPDETEERLESFFDVSLWNFSEYRSQSRIFPPSPQPQEAAGPYWINTSSNTRHNESCRYYGNTKRGHYTDEATGKACGICGG